MTSPPTTLFSRRPTRSGILAAVGGLALFFYFLRRAGVSEVTDSIRQLGWAFLIVLGLAGLRFLVRAVAWMRCLPDAHGLTVRQVLAAVLAGDALGNLTPLSLLIGEPAKAIYLQHSAPIGRTLPALAVENLFYTLSTILFIITGGVTLFLVIRPPGTEWFVTAVPLATLAGLVVGAHWIIWHQVPIASASLAWLSRHGIAPGLLARGVARLRETEARVHAQYPRDPGRLLTVGMLEFSFHLLAILEILVVLSLISNRQPTLIDAFMFEAANRFITIAFKFVPLRIGVDEAGTAMFSDLLAFGTTAGVTMAIVRKGRMLVWMAVGMGALIRRELSIAKILSAPVHETAVVVMATSPEGERPPKTRLAAVIAADTDRRHLYAGFLADVIATCRSVDDVMLRVAYAPEGGREGFETLGITDAELLPQKSGDLGAREREIFADLFAGGFSKVVLVGSDLPTLPPHYLNRAIEQLADETVVLGPATDGGYYLIGLTAPAEGKAIPNLFTEIRWSTAHAFQDTLAAAHREGIHVEQIPSWYDVDDPDGLSKLRQDLEDLTHAKRAPATTRVLTKILGPQR